jgi:hypothetical protein
MKKLIAGLATSVALTGAGMGLFGVGTAAADGPSYTGGNCPGSYTCTHWCPGDPLIPGSQVISWDWNVCHDWYWNSEGTIDVATNVIYPWHGVPHDAGPPPPALPPYVPPPPQPLPADCPWHSPILAPSRCGGL